MNKKINAALISIVSNSLLILLKIIVGIYTGAISIISEAIHSSIDLCASIIAYFAVKKSSTPPDINHQYGHQKIENISGFTEAILIFIAAIWIILEAIKKIIYPTPLEMIGIGIVIMLFSSILNIYISKILFKVSAETLSVALKADAIHLMSDVYTSFAVMTGLVFIWLGKKLFPFYNFYWIDPAFAIIVSIMIIKAGWKLTKESVYDLIDTAASENEINKINNIIKNFDNVISFKNLKTRKIGNKIFLEFDLILDKNTSFENAHFITDSLASKIKENFNSEVIIHSEPCIEQCDVKCSENCNKKESQ